MGMICIVFSEIQMQRNHKLRFIDMCVWRSYYGAKTYCL